MKKPFRWDLFSDQPYPIKDRTLKGKIRKENRYKRLKTILISIVLFPIFLLRLLLPFKRREIDLQKFFGIGVNLDKGEEQFSLLQELQIESLIVRFPLWDIQNIERYTQFISKLKNYSVLLVIMQDRENIEDLNLLEKNGEMLFREFSKVGVREFQIGNAINRSKWGFFSVDEYLKFTQTLYSVQKTQFPDLKLIGSSVIDFEYYNTIHTLFNLYKFKYHATSSLLYVDRRGEPEGKQSLLFDLKRKIELLWSIVSLSQKSENRVYITETNYPIENTEPYTPTSQYETITLQEYRNYMVRYFLISLSTGLVERVYWHQLISAGYGLVDNRTTDIKKYPAFNSFKVMLSLLSNERYISHSFQKNLYTVEFEKLFVYWVVKERVELSFEDKVDFMDIDGNRGEGETVSITKSPIYIFKRNPI